MKYIYKCLLLCLILFFIHVINCEKISCKDEKNKDVDWYVIYKLPGINTEPEGTNLGDGKAYTYITSGSSSWKFSTKSITSESMLEITMNAFYPKKTDLTYLFYNDDPPQRYNGTSVGHLKGVLAFDKDSGFWLVHSIPKFSDDNRYEYPDNALIYGQSILCVTFGTTELQEISYQLLYSHPNIYAYGITDEVKANLDSRAQTLFTDNPSFVRRNPLTRMASLKSLRNKPFVSFSKDNQYEEDLYSGIIAPGIRSSLLAETWRRGSGTYLPPACSSEFSVLDVVSINMTLSRRRNGKSIFFRSTEDHSKWAISQDGSSQNWICIGDMNRMESQEKRGGGAVCFISAPVRNAYRSIISNTDDCPV